MLKFVKWIVIGSLAVAGGAYLLFGSHVGSYVGTAARQFREGISESIPIEFELRRAENLIEEIEPQLDEAKREVAQAEVDLERVREDVERLEHAVEIGERKLKNATAAVDDGEVGYHLASYDKVRYQIDLERTFDSHKNNVALLRGKRALIERQERAVAASRSRLDAVRAEKLRLEDMVASMKTQKQQLDALAATSDTVKLDDTALSRARDVLEEIKNRLDVAQRMLEDEVFAGGLPHTAQSQRDIEGEIREFFATGADESETVIEIR